MKKLLFSTVMFLGVILPTLANDIKLQCTIDLENFNLKELNAEEMLQMEDLSAVPPIPRSIFEQISYCAQVQMDVKETYTAIFGPDRANSIALGAFMGCMGYL